MTLTNPGLGVEAKEVSGNENGTLLSSIIDKTQIDLKKYITNYPDFPKPGIQFKDISPLLKSDEAMNYIINEFKKRGQHADIFALMDSRGFLFKIPGKPSVMIRKKGKLPGEVIGQSYEKEYGIDTMEIQKGAIQPGQTVALIDDLLATGGTLDAGGQLIEKVGGEVVALLTIVKLNDPFCVAEREKLNLNRYKIESLIEYDE